ncbi:hypothetical protein TNCV_3509271 [Trichonephila clavipes]|nr:hypothetical protein TNCV_3509271 [Trichonephila clavipes]
MRAMSEWSWSRTRVQSCFCQVSYHKDSVGKARYSDQESKPSRWDDAEAWGVRWQLRYCPRHFVVQNDNVLASIHRVASE